MNNRERVITRDGQVILRVRDNPDGTRLLMKTSGLRPEHIMRMTVAPGWDKKAVDETFPEGVKGWLRYIYGDVQYDITIDTFREHAFVKSIGSYGEQYHCDRSHYQSTGLRRFVSPKREEAQEEAPTLPRHLAFGEWVPCSSCKGKPNKTNPCEQCKGLGFMPWKSGTSATSS